MDRITGRNEKGELLVNGKVVYAGELYEVASALEEYEDMEEQGKMLILPCKPSDTVYICKSVVSFGEIGDKSRVNYRIDKTKFDYWMIPYIGKTVFLTESEAEKALEGMKNE